MAEQFRVVFSLELEECEAMEAAAKAKGPEGWSLSTGHFTDAEDREAQFTFVVAANDEEELVREAEDYYARLRFDAELDPAAGTLLGFSPALAASWERARRKAVNRFWDSDLEEAVVFAHVACDCAATTALHWLLAAKGVPLGVASQLIRSTTLWREPHRDLFNELAQTSITGEEWWSEYALHVKRRNLVVHQGLAVTREEAWRSIEVSRAFCEFVTEYVRNDATQGVDPGVDPDSL